MMNLTCTRQGEAYIMVRSIKSCGLAVCLFRKDGRKQEKRAGWRRSGAGSEQVQ